MTLFPTNGKGETILDRKTRITLGLAIIIPQNVPGKGDVQPMINKSTPEWNALNRACKFFVSHRQKKGRESRV